MKNSKKYLLTMSVLTFSIFSNFNLSAMKQSHDGDIEDIEMTNAPGNSTTSNEIDNDDAPTSSSSSSSNSTSSSSTQSDTNTKKRSRDNDQEQKIEGEKRKKTEDMTLSKEINQRQQILNNISQEELYRIEHDTKHQTYNHNYQKERILSPQVTSAQEFEDTIKHIRYIWAIEAKFQNLVEQLNLIVQEIQKKLTELKSAISQNNPSAGKILSLIDQSVSRALNVHGEASNNLGSQYKTTSKTRNFFKQANDLLDKINQMSSSIHSQKNVKQLKEQSKQNLAQQNVNSHPTSSSSSSIPMTTTLGASSISNPSSSTTDDDDNDDIDTIRSKTTTTSSSSSSSSSTNSPNTTAKSFSWFRNKISKFKSLFTRANPTESTPSSASSSSSTTTSSSSTSTPSVPYNLQDYQRAIAKNGDKNLAGANLQGADLRGVDLSGAKLKGANLSGANLSYSNFSKADLQDTNLENTKIINANFSKAILINTKLNNAIIAFSNFCKANLENAELNNVYATGIIFTEKIDISGLNAVDLKNKLQNLILSLKQKQFFKTENLPQITTSFKEANLKNAKINHSTFIFVDFSLSNFSRSDLLQPNLNENTMKHCLFYQSNFNHTVFENSKLSNSYFLNLLNTIETTFKKVSFKKSHIQNCGFLKSKLENINFRNSTIQNLQFTNCEVNRVDFSFSKIVKFILDATSLINVDFTNSKISYLHSKNTDCFAENTDFTNADIDSSIFMGQSIPIMGWRTNPTNKKLEKLSPIGLRKTVQVFECAYPIFRTCDMACATCGLTEGYTTTHILRLNCIFENCIFSNAQITNSFITLCIFDECKSFENLRSAAGTIFYDVRFVLKSLYDTLRIKGAKVNFYTDKAYENYWDRNRDIKAYYGNILATIASKTFECLLGHFLPQTINHNHLGIPQNEQQKQ